MAAPGRGPGSPAARDYRAAVAARPTGLPPIEVSYGELHGMPAVFISDSDMLELAKPFEFTLVGKFSIDRPPLVAIRKFIVRLKFFGFVKVDNHDMRNVVFRFADERDYMRFFARRSYKVDGFDMRISKWSPFINVNEELPIIPLWISFPGLRYQLYHLKTLMDIAKVFGKPLCVDSNTAAQAYMTQARVLVEIDISVKHPEWIWLGSDGRGAPQQVTIENLPSFCEECKKMGHVKGECVSSGLGYPRWEPKWVPKPSQTSLGSDGLPPVEQDLPSGEAGNHPSGAFVNGPNFSNYTAFVESCRAEGRSTPIVSDLSESLLITSKVIEHCPSLNPSPIYNKSLPSEQLAGEISSCIHLDGPSNDLDNIMHPDLVQSLCPTSDITSGTPVTSERTTTSVLPGLVKMDLQKSMGDIRPSLALESNSVDSAGQVHSPKLMKIINDMLDKQVGASDVVGLVIPTPGVDHVTPCASPMEPVFSDRGTPMGDTHQVSLKSPKSMAIPKCSELVDVQVSLGGRFSLLSEEDGEFDVNAGGLAISSIKGGNKLSFSNALKFGKVVSPPPPARTTRSKTKGSALGENPLDLQDCEGWSLSKKGKSKGATGPRAVALDALLNPKN